MSGTGYRPDLTFLRELRLGLEPSVESPITIAPLIDPNEHSCGSVQPHGARELAHPEVDFYIVGMKSYGRAPTFLMLTGYEQVRSVTQLNSEPPRRTVVTALGITQIFAWGSSYYLPAVLAVPIASGNGVAALLDRWPCRSCGTWDLGWSKPSSSTGYRNDPRSTL